MRTKILTSHRKHSEFYGIKRTKTLEIYKNSQTSFARKTQILIIIFIHYILSYLFLSIKGDHTPEHVGPPVACCCIKLVDVPELEYYSSNHQGEICVKGANVFAGYFKNSENTAEAIDDQGWHHTGDIGMWLTV